MEKPNFVICGCVKNCEKYLDDVFKNIDKIINIESITVSHVIFSFDISDDKSLLKLIEYKKQNSINVDIIINKEPLTKHRTLNISNARNRIMERLEYIHREHSISHFIMMDFDDVSSKEINIEDLKNTILKFCITCSPFDCITFNNEQYYDFWALSFDEFHFSSWHTSNPRKIMREMNKRLCEYFIDNEKDYILCDSAFNGFGVYKYDVFKDVRYDTHIDLSLFDNKKIYKLCNDYGIQVSFNSNIFDCEHRMFHFKATKYYNAKHAIININLFPKYNGEHVQFLKNMN